MSTSSPRASDLPAGGPARIPIFIEIEVAANVAPEAYAALQATLGEELKACIAAHPNSPLKLILPASGSCSELVRAAGAAVGLNAERGLRRSPAHYLLCVTRRGDLPVLRNDDDPDQMPDLDPDRAEVVVHIAADPGLGSARISRTAEPLPDRKAESTLRRTEVFNRDSAKHCNDISPATGVTRLTGEDVEFNAGLSKLAAFAASAATLARAYRSHVRLAFRMIFLMGTLAAICYEAFLVFQLDEKALLPYLLLIAFAYCIFYASNRARVHEKYVDYRGLAEALRVQFYWTACGVPSNVIDQYPRRSGEFDWIRKSVRAIIADCPDGGHEAAPESAMWINFWFADQARYFEHALNQARVRLKALRFGIKATFIASLVGAALVLVQSKVAVLPALLPADAARPLQHALLTLDPYASYIKFASLLCATIAGATSGYINKMGFEYQTKHYARMLAIFGRADARRRRATSSAVAGLAHSVGLEALRESADWVSFRSERGIEPPTTPFKKPKS